MGITDVSSGSTGPRISRPANNIIFAATGVTDGTLMKGVRFFGDGIRTTSLVMQTHPHRIRFIDSIHVQSKGATAKIGSDGAWRPGDAIRSRSPPRPSWASPVSPW